MSANVIMPTKDSASTNDHSPDSYSTNVVASCPLKKEKKRNSEKAKACNYTSGTITHFGWTDDKRNNVIDLFSSKFNKLNHPVQIIGGITNDKRLIKCSIVGAGPCAEHTNHVFDILPDVIVMSESADIIEKEMVTNSEFAVKLRSSYPQRGLFTAQDILLQHTPDRCSIAISKCGKSSSINFEIFPNYSYQISGSINFGSPKLQTDPNVFYTEDMLNNKRTFSLAGKKGYDGSELQLKAEFKKIFDNSAWLSDLIMKLSSWCNISVGGIFEIALILPNITLGGNWSYNEEEDLTVSKKGAIKIDATPFIGIHFSISLLKAGLAAAGVPPWVAELPERIKDWSDGDIVVDIDCTMYADGNFNLSFEQRLNQDIQPEVQVGSTFKGGIEAHATGELNSCFVKGVLSGSADASMTFGLRLKMDKIVKPKGNILFNFLGLDVVFIGVAEVGLGMIKASAKGSLKFTPIEACDIWSKDFDTNNQMSK